VFPDSRLQLLNSYVHLLLQRGEGSGRGFRKDGKNLAEIIAVFGSEVCRSFPIELSCIIEEVVAGGESVVESRLERIAGDRTGYHADCQAGGK